MKTKKGEFVFGFIVLGLITVFVLYSIGYSPTARFVPLIVGIPGIIFMVLQLLSDAIPRASKVLGEFSKGKDLFRIDEKRRPRKKEGGETKETQRVLMSVWVMFIWVILFAVLTYFFGYLLAIPVLVFFFLMLHARAGWFFSVLSAIGIELIMYVIFIKLLNVFLYKGLIFILISGKV